MSRTSLYSQRACPSRRLFASTCGRGVRPGRGPRARAPAVSDSGKPTGSGGWSDDALRLVQRCNSQRPPDGGAGPGSMPSENPEGLAMTAPRADRRLVAILAADLVGYSRLVERDEAARSRGSKRIARNSSSRYRRAPRPHRQAHGRRRAVRVRQRRRRGRLRGPDTAGRGRAREGRARGGAHPLPHRRQPRRRGLEDGDLYGDGVNIAARLEQLAEPGGICVSGTAYDHLGASSPASSSTSASGRSRTSSGRCGSTG